MSLAVEDDVDGLLSTRRECCGAFMSYRGTPQQELEIAGWFDGSGVPPTDTYGVVVSAVVKIRRWFLLKL